jgi:hypothetical protein
MLNTPNTLNASPRQTFYHRENQDGTWDSICMRCYLTAARGYGEQPLLPAESAHHCDETSWLFVEPAPQVPRSQHLASPGYACPPSAIPRFARPPRRIQSWPPSLRFAWPAGLRECTGVDASRY